MARKFREDIPRDRPAKRPGANVDLGSMGHNSADYVHVVMPMFVQW